MLASYPAESEEETEQTAISHQQSADSNTRKPFLPLLLSADGCLLMAVCRLLSAPFFQRS
jgi:hypothetical protein